LYYQNTDKIGSSKGVNRTESSDTSPGESKTDDWKADEYLKEVDEDEG